MYSSLGLSFVLEFTVSYRLKSNPFSSRVPKTVDSDKGFDAWLANQSLLVLDFRALWRSELSA